MNATLDTFNNCDIRENNYTNCGLLATCVGLDEQGEARTVLDNVKCKKWKTQGFV